MHAGCGKYTQEDIDNLNKLHTKQLLNCLNNCSYRRGGVDCDYCSQSLMNCNGKKNKQVLLDILATREHVPNKAESKRNRKQNIKRGRTGKEPCRRR